MNKQVHIILSKDVEEYGHVIIHGVYLNRDTAEKAFIERFNRILYYGYCEDITTEEQMRDEWKFEDNCGNMFSLVTEDITG